MTIAYDIKLLKDITLFPVIVRENMRFRDTDGNGHVNNAVYATYLELARGRTRRQLLSARPAGTASVVAQHLDLGSRRVQGRRVLRHQRSDDGDVRQKRPESRGNPQRVP